MREEEYPWFASVSGDDLRQGDIIEHFPVFIPPEDLAEIELETATFRVEERDVIVMSQTCDMVKGQEKITARRSRNQKEASGKAKSCRPAQKLSVSSTEVDLCSVWLVSEMPPGHRLARRDGREEVRKGRLPTWHLMAECTLPGLEREVRLVEFRRSYSLPIAFVRKRAAICGERIRLLPPYREHLAQAYARFFMRVGLPINIPPFR